MSAAGDVTRAVVHDRPKTDLVLLQSLRAVAASLVVLYHLLLWQGKYFPGVQIVSGFSGCESGVDLFFVISGFIMMHITPRAHRDASDQGKFLFRRFARIYPTYWAVALPLLVIWLFKPELFNQAIGNRVDLPASLLLCPSRQAGVLFVAWTLTAELSYYLIASFIFYRAGQARLYLILTWFAGVVGLNFIQNWKYSNPWLSTFAQPLTVEFIAGMLLAHFLMRGSRRIAPAVAAVIIGLSVLTIFAWGAHKGPYMNSPEVDTRVIFFGIPAFLIVWMTLQMNLQGQWKALARLGPVGDRSYVIYLIHLPVLAATYRVISKFLPQAGAVGVILVVLAIIPVMFVPVELLHRLIERPSHQVARRIAAWFEARHRDTAPL